jgi:multiple sugar transport system ATP-binding protein
MRAEVSRLQNRLETTTVYVTHDQTEAMTLGDRVAVMRLGVIQQVGPPQELYENPVNLFVAGFIGSPSMNFVPAERDGDTVKLPMVEAKLPESLRNRLDSDRLIAGIRPEHFEDATLVADDKRNQGVVFKTTIDVVESMGSELYAHFSLGGQAIESEELRELAEESGSAELSSEDEMIVARLDAASPVRAGHDAELWLDVSKLHFFDLDSGRSLTSETREPQSAGA